MSNAIALSIPHSAATCSDATTPPAGPETRISAGCAAASSIVATPPDERITSGSGRPEPALACAQRAEVPGGDRAEICVDGGGRRPLELAKLGGHLVRRDDVGAGMAASQLCDHLTLVRRLAE